MVRLSIIIPLCVVFVVLSRKRAVFFHVSLIITGALLSFVIHSYGKGAEYSRRCVS